MRKLLFAFFIVCSFTVLIVGQGSTGRLVGTVSGPDGLLPGATVTITDNQTNKTLTATTNEDGGYSFEQLTFGVYTLRVTADGFKTFIATELKIDANRVVTRNATLELGDVSAEVTIQAGAEIINADNAELSTTVDPQRILDLPLNGRNPLSLVNLQAGVNPTSNSINGQRASALNVTRDGINVQDNFIRSTTANSGAETGSFVSDRPTVDNTAEFTVITQNAGVEFGNGSSQIALVTPRGGTDFHGAAYILNRNSAFAANEFGNNATGVERPFLNRNQFGGKLSGPLPMPGFGQGTPILFKDKGFFFVNYERFLLRQQNSVTNTTLLPQFRDGTFTYTDNSGNQQTVNVLTGAGLTGPIPASANGVLAVDPTIQQRILSRLPNSGNSLITNGGLTQQSVINRRDNTTRDTFVTRIDAQINDRNSISGVYRWVDNSDDQSGTDIDFSSDPVVLLTSVERFFTMAWQTSVGSGFSNEFRVGYTDGGPFFRQSPDFPTDFLIGSVPLGITNPEPGFQDQGRKTKLYNIQNNSTYSFGNHTLRFGGNFINQVIDSETNFNRVGVYNLSGPNGQFDGLDASLFPGGISGVNLGRAENLRELLGGIIGSGTISAQYQGPQLGPVLGSTNRENFRYQTIGFYIGDQWRVRPNLTVTLGLRYDYISPMNNPEQVYLEPDLEGAETLEQMREALLDPTGQLVLIGTNSGTPGNFFKADRDNFGPSISVAWSPNNESGPLAFLFGKNSESTIRGGFRVSYINDGFVRLADNALAANDGLDFTANALNANGTAVLNARFNNLPPFVLPTFQPPPISFATANANDGNFLNTIFAVDPNLQLPRIYEWNVGLQRDIGWDTAFEIRYVGGMSNDLIQGFDFNQVNINNNNFLNDFLAARNNCRLYIAQNNANPNNTTRFLDGRCSTSEYRGIAANAPAGVVDLTGTLQGTFQGSWRTTTAQGIVGQLARSFAARRSLLEANGFSTAQFVRNVNGGNVDLATNAGKYRYNALQFEVRKRFSDGLQFQGNYTFQKTLTDTGSDSQSRFSAFLDLANPGLEYQRADYDRTHTININANYELPFGKGKLFLNQGGIVDKIFGGFQLTTIVTMSSGAPLSIKDINGTLNRTGRSNRQTANSSLTVDQIRDLVGLHFVGNRVFFIDPSVIGPNGSATNGNVEATPDSRFPGQVFFRVQPGQTGTLPRAFLNGPWYYNVDASLIKNIRFGERFRIQLRADAFNLFNKTNWFIGENSSTFDIDDASGTTFGEIPIGNTLSPRIMQFGFRFEF